MVKKEGKHSLLDGTYGRILHTPGAPADLPRLSGTPADPASGYRTFLGAGFSAVLEPDEHCVSANGYCHCLGIYLAVSIPSLFHGQVPYPAYPIAYSHFLYENGIYFYMCIPLLLFQFALGLLFRNFVVPLGMGLTLVVAGIAAISWKYNYMIPSLYPFLYFLSSVQPGAKTFDLMNWTSIYTAGFLLAGYLSYVLNPRKG